LILLVWIVPQLISAGLIPPNPQTGNFGKNAFTDYPAESNSLATAIVDWIKLKYPTTKDLESSDWEAISKAFASAKLVAPENQDLLVLEFQLKQKATEHGFGA